MKKEEAVSLLKDFEQIGAFEQCKIEIVSSKMPDEKECYLKCTKNNTQVLLHKSNHILSDDFPLEIYPVFKNPSKNKEVSFRNYINEPKMRNIRKITKANKSIIIDYIEEYLYATNMANILINKTYNEYIHKKKRLTEKLEYIISKAGYNTVITKNYGRTRVALKEFNTVWLEFYESGFAVHECSVNRVFDLVKRVEENAIIIK